MAVEAAPAISSDLLALCSGVVENNLTQAALEEDPQASSELLQEVFWAAGSNPTRLLVTADPAIQALLA